MKEIILVILLCLYPATLLGILFAYKSGYRRGAQDILDIDREYDKKFKKWL